MPTLNPRSPRTAGNASAPDHTSAPDYDRVIAAGLEEDFAYGPDATTIATVAADHHTQAVVSSRQRGVIAGLGVIDKTLAAVAQRLDYSTDFTVNYRCADGDEVEPGTVVAEITAPTRLLLSAERTLLNILCHMSGIATHTRAWADTLAQVGHARVRDTRKTLPGLREIEKYAVTAGGGLNHRLALGDATLIKDNHIVAAGSVSGALTLVREYAPDLPCEVEVDSLDQLREVLPAHPELVLLDNFTVADTKRAVALRGELSPQTLLESSGGLTLESAADFGATGVDFLAVGALTHSVTVLDLGLDM